MTPPFVARALISAATPPADYESVAGDLHEEYARRVDSTGRACADRWYWSQAFRSVPSLLLYSRSNSSFAANTATGIIVVCVLLAMLLCKDMIDGAIDTVYHHTAGIRAWPFFLGDWIDAAIFGAALSATVRSQGLRLTLIASLVLVAGFTMPILFGLSASLRPLTWLLLLGAIPAMSIGAAAYQVVRRR
jgi:hypothetical protein